jgi:NADH-quinone oxidoreductase subunit C
MAENVVVEQNPKTAALVGLANGLKQENPVWVTQIVDALEEVTVFVPRENIVDVCWFLKTRHQFDMLMDLNGNDLGAEEDPRFEVIYHLFSTKTYQRIRLKVLLSDEDPHVNTVTTVWRTADWHERETYDMFGVIFDGHPDLRRILLPSDFDGHALRKDYPLRGFEPYSLS